MLWDSAGLATTVICLPPCLPPFLPSCSPFPSSLPPTVALLVAWLVIDAGCGGGGRREGWMDGLSGEERGEGGCSPSCGQRTNEPSNQRTPADSSSSSRGWPATNASLSLPPSLSLARSLRPHAVRSRWARLHPRGERERGRRGSGEATRENRRRRDPPRALPTSNSFTNAAGCPVAAWHSSSVQSSSERFVTGIVGRLEASAKGREGVRELTLHSDSAEPFPSSHA